MRAALLFSVAVLLLLHASSSAAANKTTNTTITTSSTGSVTETMISDDVDFAKSINNTSTTVEGVSTLASIPLTSSMGLTPYQAARAAQDLLDPTACEGAAETAREEERLWHLMVQHIYRPDRAPNVTAMVHLAVRGAAAGSARFQFVMGVLYSNGIGVERSAMMSALHYSFAGAAGGAKGRVAEGSHTAAAGDSQSSRPSLDTSNLYSSLLLGRRYRTGEGVPKDLTASLQYYQHASDILFFYIHSAPLLHHCLRRDEQRKAALFTLKLDGSHLLIHQNRSSTDREERSDAQHHREQVAFFFTDKSSAAELLEEGRELLQDSMYLSSHTGLSSLQPHKWKAAKDLFEAAAALNASGAYGALGQLYAIGNRQQLLHPLAALQGKDNDGDWAVNSSSSNKDDRRSTSTVNVMEFLAKAVWSGQQHGESTTSLPTYLLFPHGQDYYKAYLYYMEGWVRHQDPECANGLGFLHAMGLMHGDRFVSIPATNSRHHHMKLVPDYTRARYYFRLGHEMRNVEAGFNLAVLHQLGLGVAQDSLVAARYVRPRPKPPGSLSELLNWHQKPQTDADVALPPHWGAGPMVWLHSKFARAKYERSEQERPVPLSQQMRIDRATAMRQYQEKQLRLMGRKVEASWRYVPSLFFVAPPPPPSPAAGGGHVMAAMGRDDGGEKAVKSGEQQPPEGEDVEEEGEDDATVSIASLRRRSFLDQSSVTSYHPVSLFLQLLVAVEVGRVSALEPLMELVDRHSGELFLLDHMAEDRSRHQDKESGSRRRTSPSCLTRSLVDLLRVQHQVDWEWGGGRAVFFWPSFRERQRPPPFRDQHDGTTTTATGSSVNQSGKAGRNLERRAVPEGGGDDGTRLWLSQREAKAQWASVTLFRSIRSMGRELIMEHGDSMTVDLQTTETVPHEKPKSSLPVIRWHSRSVRQAFGAATHRLALFSLLGESQGMGVRTAHAVSLWHLAAKTADSTAAYVSLGLLHQAGIVHVAVAPRLLARLKGVDIAITDTSAVASHIRTLSSIRWHHSQETQTCRWWRRIAGAGGHMKNGGDVESADGLLWVGLHALLVSDEERDSMMWKLVLCSLSRVLGMRDLYADHQPLPVLMWEELYDLSMARRLYAIARDEASGGRRPADSEDVLSPQKYTWLMRGLNFQWWWLYFSGRLHGLWRRGGLSMPLYSAETARMDGSFNIGSDDGHATLMDIYNAVEVVVFRVSVVLLMGLLVLRQRLR